MLTRDLLRFDVRGGVIRPRFIDTENRLWLDFAENLINLYQVGIDQSEEELQEEVRPLLVASRGPLIAKGLNKLLLDRCKFRKPGSDHAQQRLAILEAASQHMRQPDSGDLEAFRQQVAKDWNDTPEHLASQLYNDLPFRQPLESFDVQTPGWLLHRYNLAQAQGLLFWANQVTLTLRDPKAGHRRTLFRYLRFLQLLAEITATTPKEIRLTIDGPLSVLQHTQKYGMKLASLLAVVCTLDSWKLEAMVSIQGSARLTLEHTDGLHSHYTRISSYQPESFTLLAQEMATKSPQWTLLANPPLLDLGGQAFINPDMTFQHQEGGLVHLELFHPWHAAPLRKRIPLLDQHPAPPPLVIGVDRGLLKDPAVKTLCENSPWFQKFGFFYLEFPPISRLAKHLNLALAQPSSTDNE